MRASLLALLNLYIDSIDSSKLVFTRMKMNQIKTVILISRKRTLVIYNYFASIRLIL